MTFADGEERLSEWLARNALVAWMIKNEPWEVEAELIQAISLPLNLQHNEQHPFHPVLSAKRQNAKQTARTLPLLR
jgi:hypothetical protein